jgi:hypothetical protein
LASGVILGLDISSRRLDAAYVPISPRGEFIATRTHALGVPKSNLIDRLVSIYDAAMRLYMPGHEWLVVEEPFGKGQNALRAVLGAVTVMCDVPSNRVWWISSGDWRRAIGVKNTKSAGHVAVRAYLDTLGQSHDELDEHGLDAIGIALGARNILAGQSRQIRRA